MGRPLQDGQDSILLHSLQFRALFPMGRAYRPLPTMGETDKALEILQRILTRTAERQRKWKLSKRLTVIAQKIAFTGCTLTAQHTTADTVLPRDIQEAVKCPNVTSINVANEE